MQDLAAGSWTWIVIGGTIVLAAVLAFAALRTSGMSKADIVRADQGAREAYQDEDRHDARGKATGHVGKRILLLIAAILVALAAIFIVLNIVESGPGQRGPDMIENGDVTDQAE